MANTVKENVKNDWEKVQQTGGSRVKRIQTILKAAASETFAEIKDGSTEIQKISRQSLAEMIAQAKAREAAENSAEEMVVVESATGSPENEAINVPEDGAVVLATDTETADPSEIPTWRQILLDLVGLVNSHKGEWSEQILARLQRQMAKFDADMETEYGERYRPFQKVVRWFEALVKAAHSRVSQTRQDDAAPVQIEVLDDGTSTAGTAVTEA